MTNKELQAAIASVTRHMERAGIASSEAAHSMAVTAAALQKQMTHSAEEAGRAIKSVSDRFKEVYDIKPLDADTYDNYIKIAETQTKEKQPKSPRYETLKYEKEVPDKMIKSEYTTITDSLKCDWDKDELSYIDMTNFQTDDVQVLAEDTRRAPISMRICLKHDDADNWYNHNPVLLAGEVAVVYVDDRTTKIKIGDGKRAFLDLPYVH